MQLLPFIVQIALGMFFAQYAARKGWSILKSILTMTLARTLCHV